MTKRIVFLLILPFVLFAWAERTTLVQDEVMLSAQADERYIGETPAPEFPADLEWLNTEGPLTLEALRGKVVLLDFWTYGCINCVHIIPDLKRLEEKYADELVVIGVHSAKFDNEGELGNIRNIVLRYELEHPVVNDKDFEVWRAYGARAWPTLVLIDPAGNVVGYHSGEGIYDLFDEVIGGVVETFDARGMVDRTAIDVELETHRGQTPLLFPGKVLADEMGERLFIADSNHNRIVVTSLTGEVQAVIGEGGAGLRDGAFAEAQFFRPQGLTLADENTLYVADTENHILRKVDLAAQTVETVAGTGEQVYQTARGGDALTTGLNSPWDVLYVDGVVYIAMAGQHQLWLYDPRQQGVRVFAGSGREELSDGPLLTAGLNQPSGLATDGDKLYFADSEASAVRSADLSVMGSLETIVGTGLFDFGDIDGVGDAVRLQHPLGVAAAGGIVYVADTYNSKIKRLDPATRESKTLIGGEAGWQDGVGESARLDEPGGLSLAGDKLYIADTNNHVIRVADLETNELSTLVLADVNGLLLRENAESFDGQTVRLEPQTVKPGERILAVGLTFPDGYKVNDVAPFSMAWTSSGGEASFGEGAERTVVEPSFPLEIAVNLAEGETLLTGDLVVYYCENETVGLCLFEQVRLEVPVTVSAVGGENLTASYTVPPPGDLDSF